MNGIDGSDKLLQGDYSTDLFKLRAAVKSGQVQMPIREEVGDWLRQYP